MRIPKSVRVSVRVRVRVRLRRTSNMRTPKSARPAATALSLYLARVRG